MLRNLLITAIAVLPCLYLTAQDSTRQISFSGSLDAYYRYNTSGNQNNYTSFTNSNNSFELGMASLRADATALSGKIGAVIDLGFGRRAEEFSYNDGNDNPSSGSHKNGFLNLAAIKQAYISLQANPRLRFTLGKFATHIGYELADAPANRNYSMSYMFTNGPFFHTGLKVDISAGPVSVMAGITDYTDQTTATTPVKNFIAQVSGGSANGRFKACLNYSGFGGSGSGSNPSGLTNLNQFDAVITATLSPQFSLGYNGTVQSRKPVTGASGSWTGNALYFNYDPAAKWGITVRSEYISDNDKIYFGSAYIFANTISVNAKVGALTLIPELRFEQAKENLFLKHNGNPGRSTAAALLAAVYKF